MQRLEVTDSPAPSARAVIADCLLAFNEASLGPTGIQPLAILLYSDDGSEVIGGLWGRTSFQWLFVELLFIPVELRSQGLGAQILQKAEAEAKRRGCQGAWLDTFISTAVRFYKRCGYQPFGTISNYPPGAARYFVLKVL